MHMQCIVYVNIFCHEIDNSLVLDEIPYDGDTLYKRTLNNLKAQAKFVHSLLSLEKIPDISEIEKGQFIVEKQSIVSGILVNDYEEQGLPTLHCALQSTFTRAPSVLLVIGAVCSAVSKKNDLYVFFDSHSHGKNGLSSSDGSSILMYFSFLEDLISYLYALYDILSYKAFPTSNHGVAGANPAGGEILPEPKRRFIAQSLSCSPYHRLEMTEILLKGRKTLTHPSISYKAYRYEIRIDMSLQFDLMPVTVKRDAQMYGHKNNSENLLEAYFKDQNLRQQGKAQSIENSTSASKESSLVKKERA